MRLWWSARVTLGAVVLCLLCSCATQREPQRPPAPQAPAGGYLSAAERPGGSLLPPPPAAASAALALDEADSRRYLAMHGGARWQMAANDAVLSFPAAPQSFACALNAPITEQDTPRLYALLRRMLIDAGTSTAATKARHERARPFMVNQQPICTPEREEALRKNGSYPSGHSAVGWAWALVLAEIAPDRVDVLLARGRAFGESRLVCNVHWRSDVVEGRAMGSATVARLHASAEFRADVAAATLEVLAARSKGLLPTRDCPAEAQALSQE